MDTERRPFCFAEAVVSWSTQKGNVIAVSDTAFLYDHIVFQLRGRIAVSFPEGSGKIFFVCKAAGKGYFFDGQLIFCQELQGTVHSKLDQILLW